MSERPRTVLVVDDDPDLRELIVLLLEGSGYRVLAAREGGEALQKLTAELPSVILLDMKMPGMNGWQFAKALRHHHGRRIPVVVMTAAEDARQTAAEVEAEAFVGKPFDLDDVLELVGRYAAAPLA